MLAAATIEAFRRDGFVVVAGLLTGDELDRFGAACDEAVTARRGGDARALAERSRYEQSFLQCINLWEDHDGVRPLTFHPRVAQAAAELLDAPAVRLWHDQALYKEPGGRLTDPHQDLPYWPIAEPEEVTAWVPFDGSTLESGALGYLPGSHRVGLRKFVDIFFSDEPYDLTADPEVAGIDPVFVEVPRGSVAFHHALTIHLSQPNRSAHTRRVHTMIYFADGCSRGAAFPHLSVDRQGIEVGQPIAGPVTPVAWPRAARDLPPRPVGPDWELAPVAPPGLLPGTRA